VTADIGGEVDEAEEDEEDEDGELLADNDSEAGEVFK
jgi:hypothetical protein